MAPESTSKRRCGPMLGLGPLQKLGCEFKAIGVLVVFWRLAQEQYKYNRLMTRQFEFAELPDLLFDFDFAEPIGDQVRAKVMSSI